MGLILFPDNLSVIDVLVSSCTEIMNKQRKDKIPQYHWSSLHPSHNNVSYSRSFIFILFFFSGSLSIHAFDLSKNKYIWFKANYSISRLCLYELTFHTGKKNYKNTILRVYNFYWFLLNKKKLLIHSTEVFTEKNIFLPTSSPSIIIKVIQAHRDTHLLHNRITQRHGKH